MSSLAWAHGGPALRGRIRSTPEDFRVDEVLGFEPHGSGEHLLLTVRKRDTNTDWLARQLAAYAGVKPVAVGYAGLKDRHAVTTQSFSVQLPGLEGPDWSRFPHAEVEFLGVARHDRKLKRGALQANRFTLLVREIQGDPGLAEQRLAAIATSGVPNYFGEQRFGFDGSNVARAQAMFAGRRVDRKTRGLLLSAARSQIFNAVLAHRVKDQTWNQSVPGEVLSLHGSRSWFLAECWDESLERRLREGDVHPSGPLWGRGALPSAQELAELETRIVAEYRSLADGLEAAGLEQDRRALRLLPQDLVWDWPDPASLQLSFSLPAGSYATVVLRELLEW